MVLTECGCVFICKIQKAAQSVRIALKLDGPVYSIQSTRTGSQIRIPTNSMPIKLIDGWMHKVIGMSASNDEQTAKLMLDHGLNFDFYFTDETALKTVVRSNPGVLVLKKGTITQKVHYNDVDELLFD